MPPKAKVTREMILQTVFQITREQGFEAVNARSIAESLNCSTRPIFTCYENMEELKKEFLDCAFAFYEFPGKRLLYGLLCLFMLIPLQVTLLPNYLLLDQLGTLNTYWALLLPLAFAPLGTFLLTQIFRSVPADILHAARLDGAGTLQVLARVLLPCGKGGVSTLVVLTLIESWNMVEQPLIYLQDVGSYPLSVFLASRYTENLPLQFVCCVLSLLPLALCFFYCGGDVLDSGIPKEEKA